MKQTLIYQPHSFGAHSCRLRVEGFPDVSSGQGSDAVGIITGWCLEWVGHPQLEGRREHLQALMTTVIPYARHLLSGVPRAMGGDDDPVSIGPNADGGHHMELRSSQADTPPLAVQLDDAELADLVRVLDQCRLDPRIQLPLPVPEPLPLPARELRHRVPLGRRLSAPVGGLAALAVAAGASALLPPPKPSGTSPTSLSAPSTSETTGRQTPPMVPAPPTSTGAAATTPPPSSNPTTTSAAPANTDEQLRRLRLWLSARAPSQSPGTTSPQTWQLAVNARGEVVGASPEEGTNGEDRTRLGLPDASVSSTPARDTLLVRGVLKPSGFWELSPWHGW